MKNEASGALVDYVDKNHDDIMYFLMNGDKTMRALALAALIKGGSENDIELVEKELKLAKKVYGE